MFKLCDRWVPRMLSSPQKRFRVQCSKANKMLMEETNNFFSQIVTGDETWVHFYDPEIKVESKQWTKKEILL